MNGLYQREEGLSNACSMADLGCLYMDEWLMAGQDGCMLVASGHTQRLTRCHFWRAVAKNGENSESCAVLFVMFLSSFVSMKSRTLIRGGRGVGETEGNLNP